MFICGCIGDFSVFEAPLIIDTANAASVYTFKILCDGHQWWLDAAGVSPKMPLRERFFRWLPVDAPPEWMPDQLFYQCQLNLLGSHDTTRFLTLLDGDQALMHLALLVQFSYPGVPCIYYGDEIGMTGENDPYNRACFDWDEGHWNRNLRVLTKRLARIRGQRTELRRGTYQTLIANGDLFAFARFDARGQCIVAINRGDVRSVVWRSGSTGCLFFPTALRPSRML